MKEKIFSANTSSKFSQVWMRFLDSTASTSHLYHLLQCRKLHSILINYHNTFKIYVKICHEAKLHAFVHNTDDPQHRVLNGPQYVAWTRNYKPEPDIFVLKRDLGPKTKLTNWIKMCATANQKCSKSKIFRVLNNVTLEEQPPKLVLQTLTLTSSFRVESLHTFFAIAVGLLQLTGT